MKTKLLTTLLFTIAAVFYSCSKESDNNNIENNDTAITNAERQIIISNCSNHSGCHAGAKIVTATIMSQVNSVLRSTINPHQNLSSCQRSKLAVWVKGEDKN